MSEVRLAVQRALDKLINRFGNQSEVIGELRAALAALDKTEAPASVKVEEPVLPPAPTTEAAEDAEPPRKAPARAHGGRKKK